ncbi:MAG TPA: tRNA pseudouridine(38-40) synthase TruA [Solirubrobacteraceae bacterium]|nr:tRNA pseudouridine(38-40) synthase TruA [Solirubrobacteraceae bacterium]
MQSRLLIEYDGTSFAGWARQPARRTVQAELERALCVLLRVDAVSLTVAGRTDAGVHALGQVASYEGPVVPARAINALLPADVAVLECVEAPDGFDARRDATSRAYRYRLLARPARSALERGRAVWWSRPLDVDALRACAAALAGTHDFTAFTPTETKHVRFERDVFSAAWRPGEDGLLEFSIEADSFMRHMVRVLVGTMLEVAGGARPVDEFVALLDGAPRSAAGRTAPAHGLYLVGVGYGGERVLNQAG